MICIACIHIFVKISVFFKKIIAVKAPKTFCLFFLHRNIKVIFRKFIEIINCKQFTWNWSFGKFVIFWRTILPIFCILWSSKFFKNIVIAFLVLFTIRMMQKNDCNSFSFALCPIAPIKMTTVPLCTQKPGDSSHLCYFIIFPQAKLMSFWCQLMSHGRLSSSGNICDISQSMPPPLYAATPLHKK